jgi:predicted nuclease of predicted toxin-antitoxin system
MRVSTASANRLVIFTHDLDLGALLANRRTLQPSVIQIRAQDILQSAIGAMVVRALHASRKHLEAIALVTVDPNRSRIRLLPI